MTAIVGANSTGKTSLLAAIHTALAGTLPNLTQMLEEPYSLGSISNLITDGQTEFKISTTHKNKVGTSGKSVTYRNINQKLQLENYILQHEKGIRLLLKKDNASRKFAFSYTNIENVEHKLIRDNDFSDRLIKDVIERHGLAFDFIFQFGIKKLPPDIVDIVRGIPFSTSSLNGISITALAPIRSKPQRTYSGDRSSERPDGEHIPFLLRDYTSSKKLSHKKLLESLELFGCKTGLFQKLCVNNLRVTGSSSFELTVVHNKIEKSILDVGYGVSQVLPILASSLSSARGTTLIMQQPEVHLHPICQAELATFFCNLAKLESKTFIVETHSDYLIDRLKIEVKNGFDPGDVVIYFIENEEGTSILHKIEIDSSGNFINAPDSFRAFFLSEQLELLEL